MKKILFLTLSLTVLAPMLSKATPCTYTQSGTLNSNITFASIITCANGDVTLNNMNSDPGGNGIVTFTTSVTLNSLTINFANGNKPIEFVINPGVIVTITNGMTFSGQADKDKFLTVNGDLVVGGTLDFGNVQFEIEGTGTIDATTITNAGDVTCSTSGTCPDITFDNCTNSGTVCTNGELPIELLYFNSNITSEGVDLTWATAKEDNFDYFSVERSKNGSDYEEIAQIKGAGFSRSILNYGFIDASPLNGKAYYRLKSIDLDLSYEYSQPIAVNAKGGVANTISISPNPLEGTQFNVLAENVEDDAKVLVYDMAGILVRELKYNSGVSLDLGTPLKSGIYMVVMNTVQTQSKTKLVVR